jgi:hypothetical protein
MNTPEKSQNSYKLEIIITTGYVLFFCAVLYILTAYLFLQTDTNRPTPINVIATNLPPRTPAPQLPSDLRTNTKNLVDEKFNDDGNNWARSSNQNTTVVVQDGKLSVKSNFKNSFTYAVCTVCTFIKEPYYLQADFVADAPVDEYFGIIFNLDHTRTNFFIIEINTEAQSYHIYHRSNVGWSRRLSGGTPHIKAYPNSNTIGIYATTDLVEIYINDQFIDSYVQTGKKFHEGFVGFLVSNAGFELSVDNLLFSRMGE